MLGVLLAGGIGGGLRSVHDIEVFVFCFFDIGREGKRGRA